MSRCPTRYEQVSFLVILVIGFMAPLSNPSANLVLLLAVLLLSRERLMLFATRPWLCLLLILGYVSSLWAYRPVPLTLLNVLMFGTDAWLGLLLVRRFSAEQILRMIFWALFLCVALQFLVLTFYPDIGYSERARWKGLMLHKTFLGHVAALAVIVAAAMPPRLVRLSERFLLLGLSCVLLVGSSSVESLLASAIGLPLVLLKFARSRVAKVLVLLPVLALVLLIMAHWEHFVNLIGRNPMLTYRVAIWESTLRCAGENPWLGYGCGRVRLLWFPSIGHAHNGILSLLLQLGLVGVFLFLLDLSSAFVNWVIERRGRRRLAERAALAYLLVFVFFNLTEPVPALPGHSSWWMLYVAATQALLTGDPPRERLTDPEPNTGPTTLEGRNVPCSG